MSHLQIVAIQIPCVGALQYLVSALDASIPQEGDGLTFVPHPHYHRRIVIRVDGEWIGYTQHLQMHSVPAKGFPWLLDIRHRNIL